MWLSIPRTNCVSPSSRQAQPADAEAEAVIFKVLQDELDTMLADPRIAEKKMPILHGPEMFYRVFACPNSGNLSRSRQPYHALRFLNNKVDQPAASPPQETMQAAGDGRGQREEAFSGCAAQALGLDRITDRSCPRRLSSE